MADAFKESQNTLMDELDPFIHPAMSTCISRYFLANHWTKGKRVLDAATGKGYGAGILLSLGADYVCGIDIDKDGIVEANKRMNSTNVQYIECDIFNLEDRFKKDEFEVCTSVETFEHLPPERIDEYLQGLKHCTSETIVITTPRRRVPEWHYNGGTHLYEYDQNEMNDILTRNFEGWDITAIGLNEVQLPNGQWGTDITTDLTNCWIFFCVLEKIKK